MAAMPASSTRARLTLALVSTAAAALAGWWVVERFGGRRGESYRFVDTSEELEQVFAERTGSDSMVGGPGGLRLEAVDAATAEALFTIIDSVADFDPVCYYRYKPDMTSRRVWPEHPDGGWVLRTNAEGLREDDDAASLRGVDLAILVTGDSHTDGACNNSESFPTLLEERLRRRAPGRTVEALNTGVAGYSFYNYLGNLRRYQGDGPDVFVVAVYGGNDFKGVVKSHHYFRGTQYPPRRKSYFEKIDAAAQVSKKLLAQSLSQVLYFQEYPDQFEVALEGALVTARETRRICEEIGCRVVYVYIPPAYEAPTPALERMAGRAKEELGLSAADLFVSDRLREQFFAGLAALGIDVLDMGPVYRAQDAPCYWSQDLHINLLGHEKIAEALDEYLAAGGGELGPLVAPELSDGPYEERDAQGNLLAQGAYEDGERAGEWTLYYPDGAVRCRGSWKGDARDGVWRWWYEDGAPKKEGTFVGGVPDGPWVEWYRNGQERHEGEWKDGAPAGTWREWREDGSLASEGTYAGGLEHGEWRSFFPGGGVEMLYGYRAGVMHGQSERRLEDGTLVWLGRYEDGARVGPWEFWHPDGSLAARGSYAANERSGAWTFWTEDGAVDAARSGTYVEGERVGPAGE